MEPEVDDTVSGAGRPAVVPTFARSGDLEDTVRRAPARESTAPRGADLDATVARGTVVPPALVEPPASSARPLPVVASLADILPTGESAETVVGAPPLRAQLPDGSVLPLDVTVYVGRRPSTPRIHTGPAPRLVTLPSPEQELSATHLELRAVGDVVVASDMRSTNGTVVHLPGSAPRTLIRGESAVVVPGTRIDLGDGAVLDILAPAPASTGEVA